MIPSKLQLITVGKVLQLKSKYNDYHILYSYTKVFQANFHTRFHESALEFQNGLAEDQLFERSMEFCFIFWWARIGQRTHLE